MADTIENPVINSPFEEPKRHFQFTDDGISNTLLPGRRESVYFVPIPKPKSKTGQPGLGLATENEYYPNKLINEIRARVNLWRTDGYRYTTNTTRRLLEYWRNPSRHRRLFFCQIEALESWIYLTEIAPKYDANIGTHLLAQLENANREATPEKRPQIKRRAAKMATGSGKTVVMAMLIAWHTLNKIANSKDKRFTDAFLIITPGITIKDRLRVLLPNDPENYYKQMDIVPPALLEQLGQAKIELTNYHAFILRDRGDAASLTKKLLTPNGQPSPFIETPGQMVNRVCKALGSKREILVLNDEAHHCYHLKPLPEVEEKLRGDDKKEAEKNAREARVWINGLEAIAEKIGIKTVYDLSATPFFLAGSGWGEGSLFPWVTSDFAMIDAIESGIIKVPRVPVADNTANGERPVYRNLWPLISKQLPKGRRTKQNESGEPQLPKELESALRTLYGHYENAYSQWQAQLTAGYASLPPVFIVVCSNTNVSKLVFDWIAGWEKPLDDNQRIVVSGQLPIFDNVANGQWTHRPNTILVDSQQLESGESLSSEFLTAAAHEIDEFKAELRERFPGRNADELTPTELLREVMNTVGKKGKLGEQVKCVVSVSMLTEGWDANSVTHILGVRAFGTQLLCEQVVGRGLRRMSYEIEKQSVMLNGERIEFDAFPVEYAEVYGVPFEFIPSTGSSPTSKPPKPITQVYSVEEREAARFLFPNVIGYSHRWPAETLPAPHFSERSSLRLTTRQVPTFTENAPIIGASVVHTLDDLKQRRMNEVAFLLAKVVLEKYFRHDSDRTLDENAHTINGNNGTLDENADAIGDCVHAIGGRIQNPVKAWLFPQILRTTKQWLHGGYVEESDYTFPQMLLLTELAYDAAERIYQAIVAGAGAAEEGEALLKPLLDPHRPTLTTDGLRFETSKPTHTTNAKSHLSHVVLDSAWEKAMLTALEHLPQVQAYVKNHQSLGFFIPYIHEGREHRYLPDFIVRVEQHGLPLHLIIEVSGDQHTAKDAKTAQAEQLWITAINNDGRFGHWAFLELRERDKLATELAAWLTTKEEGR